MLQVQPPQENKQIPVVFFDIARIGWKDRIREAWHLLSQGHLRIVIPAEQARAIIEDLKKKELIKHGTTNL